MRIHVFQHVPFEGPASIGEWAAANGHALSTTHLYLDETPPPLDDIDWLVIMGGPMSIHDENLHPWLVVEKAFIREAITGGKTVIGVCLGAQHIAHALGARVYRGRHKEIGWLPVKQTEPESDSDVFAHLPQEFTVYQWHGETFDLPDGAIRLASSEVCENQAFLYDNRVLGLQFHLESTEESVQLLIEKCGNELAESPYIQPADTMLANGSRHFATINRAMTGILDWLAARG